jgi:hypothetical protein
MNKRHIWIVLLCCLLPILGLAVVFLLKIPVSTVVVVGLVLLCPLAHFFLMGNMHNHASQPNQHHDHSIHDKPSPHAP